MPPQSFLIRTISPNDNLKKLSLGNSESAPLKTFLQKNAHSYERNYLSRTYVLVDQHDESESPRVWGYLTLVASEVETTDGNRPKDCHWPDGYHIPAIKLARMAIDHELQRRGLGSGMISWALALVKSHIATRVGCQLLITDAKRSAVKFYEKVGFTTLDTENNKDRESVVMFIHLSKL